MRGGMASQDSSGVGVCRRLTPVHLLHAGLVLTLMCLGVWRVDCLEVSTGKVTYIEAMNGSTVLLPCTYSSCIGIKNLYFSWHFINNGSAERLAEGIIADEKSDARVTVVHPRVEFVGDTKDNNISIVLFNITFEDDGEYVCFAKNPKEKNRNHSASFFVIVVDELKEIDNTVTTIVVSVIGGVIGAVVLIMVIKSLVVHFLLGNKDDEKNKECLVSSGNDNTENGLSGAKADNKGTPKA